MKRTLLLLVALCALPAFANASGFDIELQTVSATTATVRVRLIYLDFACALSPCREQTLTISVSPCPPGTPCTNGEYVHTQVGQYVDTQIDFDLEPGVTYTFTGTYEDRGGTGSPCNWNCTHSETLNSKQFHVPDAPTWTITPLWGQTSLDSVWVEARFTDISQYACTPEASCLSRFTKYVVTPCPLAIEGSNPNWDCTNGILQYRYYFPPAPIHFMLKAGVTYTFSGHMLVTGECRGAHWDCEDRCCNVTALVVPKQYTATPVAVMPSTWGKVKSLYRSP